MSKPFQTSLVRSCNPRRRSQSPILQDRRHRAAIPDSVSADQVVASGSTVTVPLRVLAPASFPVRAAMFDIQVTPLDGSPAIAAPITFTPVPALGDPAFSASQGPGDFAGAWLDTTSAGVSGANLLGAITIPLPSGTSSSSAISFRSRTSRPRPTAWACSVHRAKRPCHAFRPLHLKLGRRHPGLVATLSISRRSPIQTPRRTRILMATANRTGTSTLPGRIL